LPRLTQDMPLGQRAAHKLTSFIGSWFFILANIIICVAWMTANAVLAINNLVIHGFTIRSWDPYPFILLNFALSCQAAIVGPIVLMGQNLQAERDRQMIKDDYDTSNRTEMQVKTLLKLIKELHARVDELADE